MVLHYTVVRQTANLSKTNGENILSATPPLSSPFGCTYIAVQHNVPYSGQMRWCLVRWSARCIALESDEESATQSDIQCETLEEIYISKGVDDAKVFEIIGSADQPVNLLVLPSSKTKRLGLSVSNTSIYILMHHCSTTRCIYLYQPHHY
jgi:hypothetical protein